MVDGASRNIRTPSRLTTARLASALLSRSLQDHWTARDAASVSPAAKSRTQTALRQLQDSLQNVYTFFFGLVICIIDMKEASLDGSAALSFFLLLAGLGKQSLWIAIEETWISQFTYIYMYIYMYMRVLKYSIIQFNAYNLSIYIYTYVYELCILLIFFLIYIIV